MSAADLAAEHTASIEALARRPDMIRSLVGTCGSKALAAAGVPGIARVILPRRRGDLYRPASRGEAAELVIVLPLKRPAWHVDWLLNAERSAELVDLCAWPPGDPRRWGLRTGTASALGEGHLLWAEWLGTFPTLHDTPAAWLAAGGEGAVILRTDRSGRMLRTSHQRQAPAIAELVT